jgi:hypothetical protein
MIWTTLTVNLTTIYQTAKAIETAASVMASRRLDLPSRWPRWPSPGGMRKTISGSPKRGIEMLKFPERAPKGSKVYEAKYVSEDDDSTTPSSYLAPLTMRERCTSPLKRRREMWKLSRRLTRMRATVTMISTQVQQKRRRESHR